MEAAGNAFFKSHTPAMARDVLDATAKAIYTRLFAWIVSNCNSFLVDNSPAAQRCRTAFFLAYEPSTCLFF
jgi:myosin heavy subunit